MYSPNQKLHGYKRFVSSYVNNQRQVMEKSYCSSARKNVIFVVNHKLIKKVSIKKTKLILTQ